MKRFAVFLGLLATLTIARAEGPDDQYLRVYNLIQEADSLSKTQPAPALEKYLEAQASLRALQQIYPDWNSKVVSFRLNYIASQIEAVSPKASSRPATAPAPGKSSTPLNATFSLPPRAPPPQPSELEKELNSLKDQVRQMQADKILMEAKLKEALAAQPAAIDPRELAKAEEKIRALQKENENLNSLKDQVRQMQADKTAMEASVKQERATKPAASDSREMAKAQEKIRSLQKENDLAKYALAVEKAKPAVSAPNTRAVQQVQQELAEANRKLAAQSERANALDADKRSLQAKLDSLAPTTWNAKALEATKKALEDANRELAQQKELNVKLTSEKDALAAKLKTSSGDTTVLDALRAENQLLKKQLAELRVTTPAAGKSQDAQKLAQIQTQLAALQSEKDVLRLEKMALESKFRELASKGATRSVPQAVAPVVRPEDAARIKQLEQERDDLVKKLESASKQVAANPDRKVSERVEELNSQLTSLRARLEVFEARRVPYTPEELALFKKTEPNLAQPGGKKSVRELPAGTATLVAEAERFFTSKQLDKAEEKYLQVIAQDANNAPALANLAAIELELHHFNDAEKHITKAATLAPDDAYTLSILGYLRFMQEKYDDALDALSRAAMIEPENAQVQNYLGITLSEKGMRVPAENALRKAVQLQPDYGSAHHNLAVIYITQRPPAVELARWHYQKALASGHAHNPSLERMLEGTKTASNGQ